MNSVLPNALLGLIGIYLQRPTSIRPIAVIECDPWCRTAASAKRSFIQQAVSCPVRLTRPADQRAKIHCLGYSLRETKRVSRGRRPVFGNGMTASRARGAMLHSAIMRPGSPCGKACLLNANRRKLDVRFKTDCAAPERGLEDVADPAPEIAFTYLADQPRPCERSQDA